MDINRIWYKYSRKIESGFTFDIKTLSKFLNDLGVNEPIVTLIHVGNGLPLETYQIETGEVIALFPVYTVSMDAFSKWESRFSSIKSRWEYIDWFIPPYIRMGHISKTMERVFSYYNISQERALDEFEHAIPTLYTIPDMCVFVEQVAPNSVVLSKHVNTLRESVLSFYTGYKSAATASLIPIVESALQQLVDNQGIRGKYIKDRIEELINKVINRIGYFSIPHKTWINEQYKTPDIICKLDDRALMFRVFGNWLQNSFFSNSNNYDKRSGLNRNIFSHGLSLVWQRSTNFHRLIGVLNSLVFLEYYLIPENKLGMFYPEINDQSQSLLEDIHMRIGSQMIYNIKASERTLKTGAKMPVLTNDDGWHLRAARLSEICMSELVEKLRDKAWHCIIQDPVKDGEFIRVDAYKNDSILKIGLLYSCATSNNIYRRLEEDCDFILYLGAPYKQKQYAYGINKYVGPLQAWLIPS